MTPETWVGDRIEDINTSAGGRVYNLILPQKPTLPAVRVQRIGGVQPQHLRGPVGTVVTRVQVDSYADTLADVGALADAIRGDGEGASASGVFGYVGISAGSPFIVIHNVEIVHDGTPEYEASELRLPHVRQDYMVHWSPA